MNDTETRWMVSTIFILISIILMMGLIWGIREKGWRAESIKHRAAEYDSVTGEWQWKEPRD